MDGLALPQPRVERQRVAIAAELQRVSEVHLVDVARRDVVTDAPDGGVKRRLVDSRNDVGNAGDGGMRLQLRQPLRDEGIGIITGQRLHAREYPRVQ
mgnify:CR=1 FL=1